MTENEFCNVTACDIDSYLLPRTNDQKSLSGDSLTTAFCQPTNPARFHLDFMREKQQKTLLCSERTSPPTGPREEFL